MAKRISEFPEIVVPNGAEETVVAFQGHTHRLKLSNLVAILPIPTKAQIGLGNVDNTSDLAKPVSAATQAALDLKANASHTHSEAEVIGLLATLTGFATQISGVVDQVQALGAQVFGLNNTVASQGARLTATEAVANGAASALTSLGNRVNSAEGSIIGLQASNTAILSQIGTINALITSMTTELADHESRIDILEQEIIGDTPTVILAQATW